MTLKELQYFCTLARELHFSKAADLCFVSQPTLSAGIQKLESQWDVTLFAREANHVSLTAQGQVLLPKAQAILAQATDLKNQAKFLQNPFALPLKFGAIHTVAPYALPKLVKHITDKKIGIQLDLQEGFTADLKVQLQQGRLEAAIVAAPFSLPGFSCTHLFDDTLVAIVPAGHHLANKPTFSMKDITDERFILMGPNHCLHDAVIDAIGQVNDGLSDNNPIHTTGTASLETIKQMVASGLGVSIVPEIAMANDRDNPTIVALPLAVEVKREIVLVERIGASNDYRAVLASALTSCSSL